MRIDWDKTINEIFSDKVACLRCGVRRNPARRQLHVVVTEEQITAGCRGDAAVARLSAVGKRPFHVVQGLKVACALTDELPRTIGRSVIDDDRFERRSIAL